MERLTSQCLTATLLQLPVRTLVASQIVDELGTQLRKVFLGIPGNRDAVLPRASRGFQHQLNRYYHIGQHKHVLGSNPCTYHVYPVTHQWQCTRVLQLPPDLTKQLHIRFRRLPSGRLGTKDPQVVT